MAKRVMKSKYWHWYANSPDWFRSPRCSTGQLPWPDVIQRHFAKHLINPDARVSPLRFDPESSEEAAFLEIVDRAGLQVSKIRVGRWSQSRIEQFPFYKIVAGTPSEGFEGDEIYENQRPCPRTPADLLAYGWGCGEGGKRQIRKIRVVDPKRVKKKDIFAIETMVVQPASKIFGISRRFRDLLESEQMTGFDLIPILDGSRGWTAEQLSYDYVDKELTEQAQWFQLTVTSQPSEPFEIHETRGMKVCEQCGVYNAWQSPEPYFSEYPISFFANTDLQRLSRYRLPDGSVKEGSDASLIGSSRFVRLVVENKLSGFAYGMPREGKFTPITLKEDE